MELDQKTIKAFTSAGWSKEEIASLRVSDNLLDLYDKIERLNKKHRAESNEE